MCVDLQREDELKRAISVFYMRLYVRRNTTSLKHGRGGNFHLDWRTDGVSL